MKKRLLIGAGLTGALATAFLLGSLTLSMAGAQAPAAPTPQATSQATVHDGAKQQEQEDQQPSYTGSIAAPQDQNAQGEQDEAKALAGLAKITADQANQAALAQFPGATVAKTELENENGSLVYSVQLKDASGKNQDVKVDAGNSKVLAAEANDDGGHEGAEGSSSSEKAGAED